MNIALLALGGCLIVFVPTLVFLLVIQPIWAVFEVCCAVLFGRARRIVWLLLLLILSIVASVPYALFVTASGVLRRLTFIALFILCMVGGIGYGITSISPNLKIQLTTKINDVIQTSEGLQRLARLVPKIPW